MDEGTAAAYLRRISVPPPVLADAAALRMLHRAHQISVPFENLGIHLPEPMELTRNFGMAWGVGGWLLTPFLQKIGPEGMQRLRTRVAAGLTTTFASSYTDQVSLAGALQLDTIAAYAQQATGLKYLIIPSL